ncbi:MAG: hypothetical protein ACPGOV_13875 [Magnetovibrionaceae bacterium]
MPETEEVAALKELLKSAEEQIVHLNEELGHYQALQNDLLIAQQATDEQMVQMTEQVWQLEEALSETLKDNADALAIIERLRGNMTTVQKQMRETLEAAKQNASRVEMAARVYEMASSQTLSEDDRMAEEYEAQMRKLREKVGR